MFVRIARQFIILLIFNQAIIATAATWTASSPNTINLKGIIENGDAQELALLLTKNVTNIVVDSLGGNAEEGLKIGELLVKQGVNVEVTGVCVSSCANYIFTSGKRKILSEGIVGYHGNILASITVGRDQFIESLKKSGLSESQIADVLTHFTEVAKNESQFFKALGISQDLFDRTQSKDKGMGNGITYSILAPTAATFLKYGITGVEGDESRKVIETNPTLKKAAESGAPVLID